MDNYEHILFVTPQAPPIYANEELRGGIQKLVGNYAIALALQGYKVHILTIRSLSLDFSLKMRLKPGLNRYIHKHYDLYTIPPTYRLDKAIFSILYQKKSKVIFVIDNGGPYSRPTPQDLINVAEAVIENYPIILVIPFPWKEIEFYYNPNNLKIFKKKLQDLTNFAVSIVFPSNYCMKTFNNCINIKSTYTVSPGILQPKVTSKLCKNEMAIIGRAGIWAIHKNHYPLLEALFQLKRGGHKFKAHIIGSQVNVLGPAIAHLSLSNHVTLYQNMHEMEKYKLLSKVRLHILPSAIEAFGFSSVEALAYKIPIIGCENTATTELGDSGVILCKPETECRFAKFCGFNDKMPIEPNTEILASCIMDALDEARKISSEIERPFTMESSGESFKQVIDNS